jgi:peptidoglycan/LPS O-acetylase OafA/YrhL
LNRGRIVALDGLRVGAALVVALYTYVSRPQGVDTVWGQPSGAIFPGLHVFTKYGWIGIDLFFLISGLVICLSAAQRSSEHDPGTFFRARAIRLFPAFWPSVLITALVLHLFPVVVPQVRASDVLTNLTLLNQPFGTPSVDGVYWALWAEVRFYLLFALVLWRGFTMGKATLFGYAWLAACAVSVSSGEQWMLVVFQPTYAPLFVAGVALALIRQQGSSLPRWGLVAASFLLAQHFLVLRAAAAAQSTVLSPLPEPVVIAIEAGLFIVLAVFATKGPQRDGPRWLITAGLLTYPFYLLHTILGWTIIHYLHDRIPPYVLLSGVLVLMTLLAAVVHFVIERPLTTALHTRVLNK